MIWPQKGERA